jgi:ribonuclease HII
VRPADLAGLAVAELRRRLVAEAEPLSEECQEALSGDPRAGARAVLAAVERRRRGNRAEGQRLRKLLRLEAELWATGITRIAGVDEAGMGPLAGPVVAAAAVLPRDFRPRGLDDSKKLDCRERDRLGAEIRAAAVWAVGQASPEEIDRLNIYRAGLLAMRRAIEGLPAPPEHLLIDARRLPEIRIPQQGIVQGDAKSLSIAAASVIAKTTRDALMVELDAAHPGYGFARHKGYAAPEHLAALRRRGPSPCHRRSFAPVKRLLGEEPRQGEMFI